MKRSHPIKVRRTARPEGEQQDAAWVQCPRSHEPVRAEDCARCARLVSMGPGEGGERAVVCDVPEESGPERESPSSEAMRVRLEQLLNTHLAELTSPTSFCIDGEMDLDEAQALLEEENLASAPVVDDAGVLIGSVEKAKLIEVISRPKSRFLAVEDVMSPPVALSESMPLREAMRILAASQRESLPVVSKRGVVLGALSLRDIVRWVAG